MVKLLIIDDDLATGDFLRSFFTQKGYKVFVANDGEQGLSIVKEKKPDIILLDIKMPGFSGLEVLQKIKEIDKNAKVIMMTAVSEDLIIEMAMKYGAIGYITKPFSLECLEKDVFLKTLEKIL
ncbi:MAG: response regulator [Candidatus Omnitrophica bacterium]|nr:response regulator [Candidatus Omnitrophota bacterium]